MTSPTLRASLLALAIFVIARTDSSAAYTVTILNSAGFGSSFANGLDANVAVGRAEIAPAIDHAVIWNGPAASPVDLNPVGSSYSSAVAVLGNNQVGFAVDGIDGLDHAMLWQGTAASAIDLNPVGFSTSSAFAIGGTNEVGAGTTNSNSPERHALMWTGTANSVVDLNPAPWHSTEAYGAWGNDQVGVGRAGSFGNSTTWAMLWHGTADSMIILHEASFPYDTAALAVYDNTQVGWVGQHATLWHGTPESEVNLNPAGYFASDASGVSSAGQVGSGLPINDPPTYYYHALLWHGSADSVVDLQQFLDPQFVESFASAISDDGVIVGYARDVNRNYYAVMWTPVTVPEPTIASLFIPLLGFALITRRR